MAFLLNPFLMTGRAVDIPLAEIAAPVFDAVGLHLRFDRGERLYIRSITHALHLQPEARPAALKGQALTGSGLSSAH
jgi:hypothetical protein